jgi:hypothetical protein
VPSDHLENESELYSSKEELISNEESIQLLSRKNIKKSTFYKKTNRNQEVENFNSNQKKPSQGNDNIFTTSLDYSKNKDLSLFPRNGKKIKKRFGNWAD